MNAAPAAYCAANGFTPVRPEKTRTKWKSTQASGMRPMPKASRQTMSAFSGESSTETMNLLDAQSATQAENRKPIRRIGLLGLRDKTRVPKEIEEAAANKLDQLKRFIGGEYSC